MEEENIELNHERFAWSANDTRIINPGDLITIEIPEVIDGIIVSDGSSGKFYQIEQKIILDSTSQFSPVFIGYHLFLRFYVKRLEGDFCKMDKKFDWYNVKICNTFHQIAWC
jgi:hypothetical protein